ncbi:MAG: RAD55 family ATPase [Cuniculiplasma sp.]
MESSEIATKINELQQLKDSLEKTIKAAEEKKREIETMLQGLIKVDSAQTPQVRIEEAKKIIASSREPVPHRTNRKLSTGVTKIDELLLGGLPLPSNIVLFGAPFTSKDLLASNFMANSLKENIPVVILTADKDINQIKYEISRSLNVDPDVVEGFEDEGMIRFVDVYSKSIQSQSTSKKAVVIDSITNLSLILKSVEIIEQDILKSYPYYRLVFISLTAFVPQFDEKVFMKFTQQFTQKRKANNCSALYMLEDGLFDQKVFETISYIMDGTIEFKIVNSKQYVKVVGLSNARTREWVEVYNRGETFDLGSFSLERVR